VIYKPVNSVLPKSQMAAALFSAFKQAVENPH